jgi:hypothetical protein
MLPFSDLAAALRCWFSGREGDEVRPLGLDEMLDASLTVEELLLWVLEGGASTAALPPKLALSNKNQSNQRVFFSE